jgi:hypothetical protein
MVQANPQLLGVVLQQLGQSNPELLNLINQHQEEFIQLLNSPITPTYVAFFSLNREPVKESEGGRGRERARETNSNSNPNPLLTANNSLNTKHEIVPDKVKDKVRVRGRVRGRVRVVFLPSNTFKSLPKRRKLSTGYSPLHSSPLLFY